MARFVVQVNIITVKNVTLVSPREEDVKDILRHFFERGDIDTTTDKTSTMEILKIEEVK